jgi:hypothetical protein
MIRTVLGSVAFFIAYCAICVAAIDTFDAGRRLDGGLCIAAAVLLSVGFWWEDRAVRRAVAQTEMVRQAADALDAHIRKTTATDTPPNEHLRQ